MEFSHIDKNGEIKMVDISEKEISIRNAMATGKIFLQIETIDLIKQGDIIKGNVLTTAKLAGIMAAKKTPEIIPLCHQINLTSVDIGFIINNDNIEITSLVSCIDKTGAEMEALHSVMIAALTIYDMCKAVDKNMMISEIKLCRKSKKSV